MDRGDAMAMTWWMLIILLAACFSITACGPSGSPSPVSEDSSKAQFEITDSDGLNLRQDLVPHVLQDKETGCEYIYDNSVVFIVPRMETATVQKGCFANTTRSTTEENVLITD